MSEMESRQPRGRESEADPMPARVPLAARLVLPETPTARWAAPIIVGFTSLAWLRAAGWSGSLTAGTSHVGAVMMLTGIGFVAVVTAPVMASLTQSGRRLKESRGDLTRRPGDVTERAVRVEAMLARPTRLESSDGLG